MSEITQAEQYLLDQIRLGQAPAWSQLIDRFQGRLLAYARTRLPQSADAEDLVQETFIGLLKSLPNFRGQASLETWLFTILRRKIIDTYRSRHAGRLCLLQDVYQTSDRDRTPADPADLLPSPDPTASWYVGREEQYHRQAQALTHALRQLVNALKQSLNFRDLQIVELLFYGQLSNKNVASIVNVPDKHVAVIKHRCLKQVRAALGLHDPLDEPALARFENFLTQLWESQRLSCPKRSTIGAFLLQTLDPHWHDYVAFHLEKLGCHFCRANLDDLQQQNQQQPSQAFRRRILESTVGFLHQP